MRRRRETTPLIALQELFILLRLPAAERSSGAEFRQEVQKCLTGTYWPLHFHKCLMFRNTQRLPPKYSSDSDRAQ